MAETMEGRCLCGAVEVTVRGGGVPQVSGCHCDLCRRWSGSMFTGFDVAPENVTATGEVARFASSHFSERVFCPVCGTHLWFRDTDGDAPFELSPGLFVEARDWPLDREVYADRAAAYLPLSGDHRRVTRADYERDNRFVDGDTP